MSHLSTNSLRVTIYFNLHLYFSLNFFTFHLCMYKYMYIYSYFTYLFIAPNCDEFSNTYTNICFNNIIPKFLVVTFSKVTCIAKVRSKCSFKTHLLFHYAHNPQSQEWSMKSPSFL